MYTILWYFRAKAGEETEFERAYGSRGTWAQFFSNGIGFLGTELHPDPKAPGRYLTIDRWESRDAYESFSEKNKREYTEIDSRCEALTSEETLIGYFASSQSL